MANFYYRALDSEGRQKTGEKEAEDKFSLARILRGEGLTVIAVEDVLSRRKKGGFSLSWRRRVSLRDKIIFANNLSAMLSAGLSLSRALSVLERQTDNKFFGRTVGLMVKAINKGSSFSQALTEHKKVFPEVFVAMVETAEESGKLPETLKLVANQLEKSYGLQRKIIGALIYPAIIVLVIIAIAILMMVFLVPTLSATFKELGVPLPLSTRIVIGTSDFLVNNLFIVGIIALFILMFVISFLKTKLGNRFLAKTFLFLPVFGRLTKSANSAKVLRTISSLISAGVGLGRALEITGRVVTNHYYRQVIINAKTEVEKGRVFSDILAENDNLFPIFASEMTAVGEETGRLSDLLLKGAEFFEDEVDQATKNLSTVIEPFLMVVIGLAVGLFAISMIGPMYSLSNAIK